MEDGQKHRKIPLSGQGDEQSLSGQVCESPQVADPTGESTDRSALPKGVGGIRQAALWTSQSGAGVPGQIHPQSSDLQPPDSGHWPATDHLQLQRLPSGSPKAGDEPGQSGVYPPVLHAYPSQRTGADPAFWHLGKLGQANHDSADPWGAWGCTSRSRTESFGSL